MPAYVTRRQLLATSAAAAGAAATAAVTSGGAVAVAPAAAVHEQIVRDARMLWRRLPDSWQTAPFLGNGFLAVHVYGAPGGRQLTFMVNHSEVQDQRPQWEAAIGLSRLPIGFLTLTMAGAVTAVNWTLDLWNAELSGTVTTTQGSTTFSALVHSDRGVLVVSSTPSAGEQSAAWGFQPLPSSTTRTTRRPPDYVGNPPATTGTSGSVRYAEQRLLAGGGYTTAWQERRIGSQRILVAAVRYRFPDATSRTAAVDAVTRAQATDPAALIAAHRAWWNAFYVRSVVSVPDKRLQRFYWIQLYKMASATRANAPVLAEWGPWFPERGNNWTAVWWNLNVQVAYPMINGSNHLELDAVTATFRRFESNLPLSVPTAYRDGNTYALSHPGDRSLRPGGTRTVGVPGTSAKTDQTGNLLWGLHTAWVSYRHTMNQAVLRDVLYPILAKAVNFYLHFLTTGTDGRLHLPLTRSPEYADAADCTYDVSLIRWGCATLIESAQRLGISDPRVGRWRDVLARLVPYHSNSTGTMIGKGVPLSESHRHFSHLLWLYPLREALWDREADRDVMRRSLNHWASMRSAWHGYSFAAASSMASVMDSPEEALGFLQTFIDRAVVHNTQLTPNTMYREGSNFAIESPLAAAQSLLDMVVQSHGTVVKVFPSISSTWRDASIAGLLTQGAFVVDASRSGGRTDWVRITSRAGEPLILQHGIDGPIDVRDDQGQPIGWTPQGPGRISLPLASGRTAVVTRSGARPDLVPRDVPANGTAPAWGLP